MRIPWPGQLNLKGVLYFSLALMIAQLFLGTNPLFAAGIFYFMMVAAIGFNIAGGMNTFTGSYIGFMSLQTIVIAQMAKIFYLQPADSHLMTPLTTVAVYDMGITCVAFAAYISGKYKRKYPIFNADTDGNRLVGMSIAASILGSISLVMVGLYGFSDDLAVSKGDIYGLLNQFGGFLPLGILLGTAYIIHSSRGTRSARWWTIAPMVFLTVFGIAAQSKQGIFQPVLMWLLVCAAYSYKLNRKQIITLACTAVFAGYIIFPVVQYMRGSTRSGNIVNRGRLVVEYLSDNSLLSIRDAYIANEQLREESSATGYFYYGTDKEALDRLSLVEMDDAIIYRTEMTQPRGAGWMLDGALANVPRVIWPTKAKWEAGVVAGVNVMGREIGILAPSDYTTFISFSFFGTTFFMMGWAGSAILILLVLTPFFLIMDSVYGNVQTNIFALFVVLGNMHGAPEFTPPVALSVVVHSVFLAAITIWFIRTVSPAVTIFLGKHGLLNKQEMPSLAAVRA